ncbi:hypothetical protein [Ancylobacter polymorphus]|uniref:Uncharacterized protein n=1 Tax=Ancylobacter polymorphus TaxID=223390 RepID=A0A9E6ZVW8_9HYPH|nr:hypothetical protein [Ancylobacter polymorphus]UOK72689.1 hypothetical protein K9D25_08345 [Ancylobacter polymorphus]
MTGRLPTLAGAPPLVAYGVEKAPANGSLDGFLRMPVRPGELLRLNDEALDLPPPAIGQETTPTDVRLAEHLKRLAGGWNRSAGLFIDVYFAHLRSLIARHREEIDERLGGMAGLFAPEDVLYAAPLPLPRALVPLAAGVQIPVDMFLWLGETALAVLFDPSPLLPSAERRRQEHLAAAGIVVRRISAADLSRPDLFAELLGERGNGFWRDNVLPIAPGAPRLPSF